MVGAVYVGDHTANLVCALCLINKQCAPGGETMLSDFLGMIVNSFT